MNSITLRKEFAEFIVSKFLNAYPKEKLMKSGKHRIAIYLKGHKARWIMMDAESHHLKIVISIKANHITEKDLNTTGIPVTENKGSTHIWLSSNRDLINLAIYLDDLIDFSNDKLLALLKKGYEGFVSK